MNNHFQSVVINYLHLKQIQNQYLCRLQIYQIQNPCSRQESKVRATQNDIDNGKRLAGQNQINLSRQKLTVESVTKIVNPDNATLTLKNEIDLLKK